MTRTKGRSCTGKRQYTKADAKKAALWARRRLAKVYAYKCKFCGHFHIGHPPRKRHN